MPVPIDLTYLKHLAQGDEDLIKEIAGIFLDATPAALQRLEAAYGENDWRKVTAILHSVRPSFEAVGFLPLSEAAYTIEDQVKHGQQPINELGTWLAKAHEALDAMQQHFAAE